MYKNKISDNDNYKNIYKTLDEYQKDGFKNKIIKNDMMENLILIIFIWLHVNFNIIKIKTKRF